MAVHACRVLRAVMGLVHRRRQLVIAQWIVPRRVGMVVVLRVRPIRVVVKTARPVAQILIAQRALTEPNPAAWRGLVSVTMHSIQILLSAETVFVNRAWRIAARASSTVRAPTGPVAWASSVLQRVCPTVRGKPVVATAVAARAVPVLDPNSVKTINAF